MSLSQSEVELEYARLARSVGRLFFARKNQGLPCVLLNLLTKHEWIKEDVLAKELGLSWRQVKRALHELEREFLIKRVVLRHSKAGGAAGGSSRYGSDESSAQSYCCLDYKKMVDLCRLKYYQLRRYLRGEQKEKATIEGYVCPNEDCGKTYSALEAVDLEVDDETFMFLCGNCDETLEKAGAGDKTNEEKQKHREMLKEKLALFEKELEPFGDLLKRLQPYNPPYFGSLQEWATAQKAIMEAKKDGDADLLEQAESDFVIDFQDERGKLGDYAEALKGVRGPEPKVKAKELPPWMRLGFNDVRQPGAAIAGGGIQQKQEPGTAPSVGQGNATATTAPSSFAGQANGKRFIEDADGQGQAKRPRVETEAAPTTEKQEEAIVEEEDEDDVEWEDM